MLAEERFESFKEPRMKAMGDELREIADGASHGPCTFEERTGTPLGAEADARRARRAGKVVEAAMFKDPTACVEGIVHLPDRRLSGDRIMRPAARGWAWGCDAAVVVSKTGRGKPYICQAIGNAACRKPIDVRCARTAGICEEPNRARAAADGSRFEAMDGFKAIPLPIIGDFVTTPISTRNAIDLFETLEARESTAATAIAPRLEPNERRLRIEGELMADSVLSRTAEVARYVDIDGPDMREYFAKKKQAGWRHRKQLARGTVIC